MKHANEKWFELLLLDPVNDDANDDVDDSEDGRVSDHLDAPSSLSDDADDDVDDSEDGRASDHLDDPVTRVEHQEGGDDGNVYVPNSNWQPHHRHRRKKSTWKSQLSQVFRTVLAVLVGIAIVALLLFASFAGLKSCSSHNSNTATASESKGEVVAKADASKTEEAEAINTLTVEKLTVEELEALTADKYKDVSWVFLDSSLSTHDRVRTERAGFSDALTYGFSAKDDAKRFIELQEEILRNPVYGVTVVNALRDKKIGDKTVESFNPWMKEIATLNDQYGVAYWLEKEGDSLLVTKEYRIYAATLCTWLERLVCQGEQTRQTVENWCLNAAAMNNDRKGIKASYQYSKESLVFAYIGKNKGSGDESLLVIGFNIHDKRPEFFGDPENPVKATPTPPTPTPSGGGKPSGGGNPDKPDNPDNPDNPSYNKDPNKAPKENTEPNDDPGPGPSTNNGVGATESTADQPTNSNHESYPDYRDDVKELEEINQSQSTGSEPSTPSTPAPSPSTNVDNNGDSGTETSAPINNPTPVAPPATEAGSGEPINSNPGEAWGGPTD